MTIDLPDDVLEAITCHVKTWQEPEKWHWESLTTTNPAMRIVIDGQVWVVKKSRDDRKDEMISRLFGEYGVSHHQATRVGGRWILMRDAGSYTLESMPQEYYSLDLFSHLGRLAASALLIGMRDRKLGNIAVNTGTEAGPVLSHIDYEGAFRTGLLNRILRPRKYFRYLLTRLLFDVAIRFGEGDHRAAFSLFHDAFREEWARLGRLRPSPRLMGALLFPEKVILWSARWSADQACKLMQDAFDDLVNGQPHCCPVK